MREGQQEKNPVQRRVTVHKVTGCHLAFPGICSSTVHRKGLAEAAIPGCLSGQQLLSEHVGNAGSFE